MHVIVIVFLVSMLILAGSLFYYQALDPNRLADKAVINRLVTQEIPAKRGDILDKDGKVMATSVQRFDIVVDQLQYQKLMHANDHVFTQYTLGADGKYTSAEVAEKQGLKQVAQALGLQPQQVERAVIGKRRGAYIFQGATQEQKDKALDVGMPGIFSQPQFVRQYPMGQIAGSLVGYMNSEKELGGIELMERRTLTGKVGSRTFEIGRDGIRNPYGQNNTTPAEDGSSVKLTIDSDLQWYSQQVIATATAALNGEWGNAIVMDIKTGKILTMADSTSVDPNDVAKHKGEFGYQPIGIVDGFEPGSTAKVITFAGALEQGKITPITAIDTPNRYTVDGEEFKDYEDHPLWHRTAAGVLARSLNTGTVQVGEKLTQQERYDWLRKFGVGQKVGLGFPGEQTGLLAPPDKWDLRQQYTVTFGQGFTQTALHTAQIYQTIANYGTRVKPQLIESTIAPDGTESTVPTAQGERIISEKTAKELIRMMENVTVDGSGSSGQLKNYRVASKTGTAQSVGKSGIYDAYTISYAGLAPAESPRYVVVVTISRTMEMTSVETGPVFAKIMERVLTMNNVPPSTTKPDLYPTFSDGTPNEHKAWEQ